jgi:outer membrane receptor protein involved in Fe transport
MRILTRCLAVLLGIVLAAPTLLAGSTGKISGVVRDSRTREPLPGVNVTIPGTSLGASSAIDGRYVILNVPPGKVKVVASFIGYRRFEVNDLRISTDFTTQQDIDLVEGSVELDAVVIQAERTPLIRQDLTNPVASISSESIEALPVTDISEVIGLQAGVTVDDDGSIHIRGGLGNEIAYTLNGMNINNPYGNTRSVGVATNAVREVSVSSGTFSAEFGSALSGVVNYVTRDGGVKWAGSLKQYFGDHISSHKDLFYNINKITPTNVNRTEATLSGPVLGEDLTFFASGVYNWNGGHLYGQRIYLPTDAFLSPEGFLSSDPRRGSPSDPLYFAPLLNSSTDRVGRPSLYTALYGHDSTYTPDAARLNWSRSYNVQGNIAWRVTPSIKLKYEFVHNFDESPDADAFAVRYKPDGNAIAQSQGFMHSLEWTHSVNENMFYTVKGSYIIDKGHSWTYDDPYDARYLPSFYQMVLPNTSYLTGGTDLLRFSRKTVTIAGKADIVAQWGSHEVKAGVEARKHKLTVESYTLQFRDPNSPTTTPNFSNALLGQYSFKPYIPDAAGGYIYYERQPLQMAGYVQDKIELFKSIILNLGLRYEYFDPAANYNPSISSELALQDTIFLQKNLAPAEKKHMLSPRVSVSYPITDQGTIRFSYGHFYQVGSLSSLYSNPNFRAPSGTSLSFGNPNVNPQMSVQYELGMQQGLTEDLKVEITGYYKDVRDYIYSQTIITPRGDKTYNLLTNLSYANTRGISISIMKRRSPNDIFSATLDYTFQVSEGNRTLPTDEIFFSEQAGRLSQTYLVPLGFDRSHTLTSTVMLSQPNDWGISMIAYLRTGTPYTPSFPSNVSPISFTQNSDRQPMQWNVDLKIEKFFTVSGFDMSVFVQVDNLFDVENELYVYANSGRALYNIEQTLQPEDLAGIRNRILRGDPGLIPLSGIDNYYANPGYISTPRLVRVGASLVF